MGYTTYHELVDFDEYYEPPELGYDDDDDFVDDETWDYDTGPFCMHWSTPHDCDENCDYCGHPCREHSAWGCSVDECGCGRG
jgi:hypothetical protein